MKDEGIIRYFARYWYLPCIAMFGLTVGYKVYNIKYQIEELHQDFLDYLLFDQVKLMGGVDQVRIAMMKAQKSSQKL